MNHEFRSQDIFFVIFSDFMLGNLLQIQARIIQKITKTDSCFLFSSSTFYIWRLHSSRCCVNSSFCPRTQFVFSSIKLRSPKSNESKLYELKQTQQISTIHHRYQLTFDHDMETIQFSTFKWNLHEDLNLLVKDSSANAKGWKIVKDDFSCR